MRSFDQLRFLVAEEIRDLVARVSGQFGPHLFKLALSEMPPALRQHVFQSMSDDQRRAVIESPVPEGLLSHDDLPAARWQIMEVAEQMENAGEIEF